VFHKHLLDVIPAQVFKRRVVMTYSRRQFGKMALGTVPLASSLFSNPRLFAAERPNSKFNGVQIGVIIPYSFHNMPADGRSLLNDIVEVGISACETHNEPVEQFFGAPIPTTGGGQGGRGGQGGGASQGAVSGSAPQPGGPRREPSPEQRAAQKAAADALWKWRSTFPVEKFGEYRKMYENAGVSIYAYKITLTKDMPDEEYDYAFNSAKVLGANQITMEMPTDSDLTNRIGQFASKHKIMVGYHEHLQAKPTLWEQALSQSPYNGINLDIGHYVQAGNHDVMDFIKKNHARITSLHLKDDTYGSPGHAGDGVPWGQGNTPIKEALQLVKTEGYKFPCTIELEYTVPPGSDSVKEVAKCLTWTKAALA
jgi:sugar phosphate isomerase/epimerase